MALFWQQSAFLAHDFLHHQVFTNRSYNNLGGLFFGNIWQGFSTSWWKAKHNHHHASTNVVHTQAGGDPDIMTMPFLLWSEKIIEGDTEDLKDLPKFMVRYQKFFYLPLNAAARISWLLQLQIKRIKYHKSLDISFPQIPSKTNHTSERGLFVTLTWPIFKPQLKINLQLSTSTSASAETFSPRSLTAVHR